MLHSLNTKNGQYLKKWDLKSKKVIEMIPLQMFKLTIILIFYHLEMSNNPLFKRFKFWPYTNMFTITSLWDIFYQNENKTYSIYNY